MENFYRYYNNNYFICEFNLLIPEDIALMKKTEINLCKEIIQKTNIENAISIYDLLDYFTAEEKLIGNYLCTDCHKCNQRTKKLELNKFPNILIINLKRFRYDLIQSKGRNLRRNNNNNNDIGKNQIGNYNFAGEKIETKIDFPFTLNLKKFTKNSLENISYDLYSVCNHDGKISGGHYKAICKDFQTGNWFEFDDKIVKPINEENIVTHKAYILFYRKKV
jgi:ubiquitin C-terminal hydrolase